MTRQPQVSAGFSQIAALETERKKRQNVAPPERLR